VRIKYGISAVLVMLPLFTACGVAGADPDPPPPGAAVLDWENASIDFPLERFEMSPFEMSAVWAARNIAIARCFSGSDEVPEAELSRSAKMLTTPDMSMDAADWAFGWWDANFIENNGVWSTFGDFGSAPGMSATADSQICLDSSAVADLTPGCIFFTVGNDMAFDKLSELHSNSAQSARLSSLAKSLSRQMDECLAESGYEMNEDDDGRPSFTAKVPENWSEEEQLRAIVASATCNDELGITQQMANLTAGYEEQAIAEHEAELLAIRAEAERRLGLAHELLREVGLE
jgi:hypothetical protein